MQELIYGKVKSSCIQFPDLSKPYTTPVRSRMGNYGMNFIHMYMMANFEVAFTLI